MWPFDQSKQDNYQQYAQAYNSGNFNNVDPNQASGDLQTFAQNAPPDVQQRIYAEHFSQLPPDQRALIAQQMPQEYGVDPNDPNSMAQGFSRLGQERPDVLQGILSHPLLIGASVALAGLVAKHMLDEHRESSQQNQQAGDRSNNGSFL
ncbi:MAG: hypothetical protein NVS2B12_22720 [Ktedonobacteraceae bacterium]